MLYTGNVNFKKLLSCYCKIAHKHIVVEIFIIAIAELSPSVTSYLIAGFVDTIIESYEKKVWIDNYTAVSLAMIAISTLVQYISQIICNMLYDRGDRDVRHFCELENMRFINSLSYRYMENKESCALIKRSTGVTPDMMISSHEILVSTLSLVFDLIGICLVLSASKTQWIIVIVFFAILPSVVAAHYSGKNIYLFSKIDYDYSLEMYHDSYILKSSNTAHERTLFNYSNPVSEKLRLLQNKEFIDRRKLDKKLEINMRIPQLISWFIIVGVIAILSYLTFSEELSIGLFAVSITYIISLFNSVSNSITTSAFKFAKIHEYQKDINKCIRYSRIREDTSTKAVINEKFESLEFDHVSFTYPDTNREILKDVSFIINNGKSYAFIGLNGAGKSTILKLIIGLYDNYTGNILINGRNIRTMSFSELNTFTGVIFQDYAHYPISIHDNITIGALVNAKDKSEVQRKFDKVKNKLNLDSLFNHLPKGVMTNMGKVDDNSQISGGEWQKIALARLMMSDAGLYILDEPSSSLDPIMESELYEYILTNRNNRAVVLITHRIGITRKCDHIYVLNDGAIVQHGSFEKLINSKGLFCNLYNTQAERYK